MHTYARTTLLAASLAGTLGVVRPAAAQTPAQEWSGFINVQIDLSGVYTASHTDEHMYGPPGAVKNDWRTTHVDKVQSGDRYLALTLKDGKVTKVFLHKRSSVLGWAAWAYERNSTSNWDNPRPTDDYYWVQTFRIENIALDAADVTADVVLEESGRYTITLTGKDRIDTEYMLIDVTNGYNNAPGAIEKIDEDKATWTNPWTIKLTGTTCDALKAAHISEETRGLIENVEPGYSSWYTGSKTAYQSKLVDTLATRAYVFVNTRWDLDRKPPKNGAFAIVSEIEYPAHQHVKIPNAATIPIRLTTCGTKQPLANVKLTLATDKGKLGATDVVTDANGRTQAMLLPPDKSGEAHVTMTYELTRPDGTKEPHREVANVEFSKPKSVFPAHLMVRTVTNTRDYDPDGAITAKSESESRYDVDQVLDLNPEVFNTRIRYPNALATCGDAMSCPVLSGTNNSAPTGQAPRRTPAMLTMRSQDWERVTDENGHTSLQMVRKSDGGGSVDVNTITTAISLIADKTASPNYYFRMVVQVGSFAPNSDPTAPRARSSHYDADAKKWVDDGPPKYGLQVPDTYVLSNQIESEQDAARERIVKQPELPEGMVKALLRNPDGSYSFNTNATQFDKMLDGNGKVTRETETKVWVILQLK